MKTTETLVLSLVFLGNCRYERAATEGLPIEGPCKDEPNCCPNGTQCYRKNIWWSGCLENCTPGMVDEYDHLPWDCVVESNFNCGELLPIGSFCKDEPSCCPSGTKCFSKNESWSGCLESCTPGMFDDLDGVPWECTVDCEQLLSIEDDCRNHPNCCPSNTKCYRKNQWWSGCLPTCIVDMVDEYDNLPWECTLESTTTACPPPPSPTTNNVPTVSTSDTPPSNASPMPDIFTEMKSILLSKKDELNSMLVAGHST